MKTREEILHAGLKLWREKGVENVNARNVGELINKTHPTIYYHYETRDELIKAVAEYGVQTGDSVIIVSLMLTGDPLVANLTDAERHKHLDVLKNSGA